MKCGLFKYTTKNIGDEIQSIAAKQFLPKVDILLNRDYLNEYNGEEIKLIMNGWYSHKPQNWPPSLDIDPLFISFHISDHAKKFYTSKESINYFSKHEPIGCRDYQTRDLLLEYGVNAYFSGCLTMTLTNKYSRQNSGDIYLVDVDQRVVNKLPQNLHERAEYLTHHPHIPTRWSIDSLLKAASGDAMNYERKSNIVSMYKWGWNNVVESFSPEKLKRKMKFRQAQYHLNKYSQAKLVITSRLHATLPCIAFDTPVILIHENPSDPRFAGLKEYINLYSIDEFVKMNNHDLLSNVENPDDILEITEDMEDTVEEFLSC